MTVKAFTFFATLILAATHIDSVAQSARYTPRGAYQDEGKVLLEKIKAQLETEFQTLKPAPDDLPLNDARKKYLTLIWKNNGIIRDDTLENYVNNIVSRIARANQLPDVQRHCLIVRDTEVNARCYGKGLYLINIGLLGRISREEELAFTLAHEMAHDEMNHVQQSLRREIHQNFTKTLKKEAKEVFTRDNVQEEIKDLQSILYPAYALRRKQEIQADSMALVLMRKADYAVSQSLSMLDVLAHRKEPKYDVEFEMFLPFHSEAYPFQDYWLNERVPFVNADAGKDTVDTGFHSFALDSLQSHPEIEKRKELISKYLLSIDATPRLRSSAIAKAATEYAEYETIETSFQNGNTEDVLLNGLILLQRKPQDSYLISRIAAALIMVYDEKSNTPNIIKRGFASKMSPQRRLVKDFLLNINAKEAGDLTYHFMDNKNHFDESNPDHYYLKWKICDLTYRNSEKKILADQFKKKFATSISSHRF